MQRINAVASHVAASASSDTTTSGGDGKSEFVYTLDSPKLSRDQRAFYECVYAHEGALSRYTKIDSHDAGTGR